MQKFSCGNSSTNLFKTDSIFCPVNSDKSENNGEVVGEVEKFNSTNLDNSAERGVKSLSIRLKDESMENGNQWKMRPHGSLLGRLWGPDILLSD